MEKYLAIIHVLSQAHCLSELFLIPFGVGQGYNGLLKPFLTALEGGE
jgi:hypothetical protein